MSSHTLVLPTTEMTVQLYGSPPATCRSLAVGQGGRQCWCQCMQQTVSKLAKSLFWRAERGGIDEPQSWLEHLWCWAGCSSCWMRPMLITIANVRLGALRLTRARMASGSVMSQSSTSGSTLAEPRALGTHAHTSSTLFSTILKASAARGNSRTKSILR